MTTPANKTPDPRQLVYRVLVAVLEKNQSLDEALEAILPEDYPARERAFARNLAATTFRHLAFIDKTLSSFLKRPLQKRALWVRHWMRLGAAQILFLEVADHAAVNTSVEAISRSKKPGGKVFKGLANGILRNVIRNKEPILKKLEDAPEDILPRWIKGRWTDFYDEDTVREIGRALLHQPPLDISLKNPKEAGDLAKALGATEVFPGTLRLRPKGKITALSGFREGAWWAQDLAASLPPRLFGDVKGKRVLDLCAAPGGKTLFLASRGANVTAVDLSKNRLKRVGENLKRTGLKAEVIESNVLAFKPKSGFDFILLDAPCSATGTLRRHPDVPYHRGKTEIERLSEIQQKLLAHAFGLLNPGGALIYCVCSLEREESEDVIMAFLAKTPAAKRVPIKADELEGRNEWITETGDLRTLPHHLADEGGMDGFYAARISK